MASFELKILTEDPAELKGLVDKLCASIAEPRKVGMPTAHAASYGVADADEAASQEAFTAKYDAEEAKDAEFAPQQTTIAATAPIADRDAEGLKRDARIHSDAAEPFKTDGTWKRKRNTPDDIYDEVYEELARESHAAGLYKGPLLGQFELEARVVDTEQALVAEQQAAPAPTPVVEPPVAPAPSPVAPAPQAAPAPVAPAPAGLSAQVSSSEERCKSLLTSMVKKVGPAVAVAALRMYGATAVTMLTPDQRESFCDVAEALLGDADATSSNGSDKLAEIAALLGVAV